MTGPLPPVSSYSIVPADRVTSGIRLTSGRAGRQNEEAWHTIAVDTASDGPDGRSDEPVLVLNERRHDQAFVLDLPQHVTSEARSLDV